MIVNEKETKMYKIQISTKVMKELDSIDEPDYSNIKDRLFSLEKEPFPVGAIKLTNEPGYRIRSGNYRILYVVNHAQLLIKIYKIGHRKEVYKKK